MVKKYDDWNKVKQGINKKNSYLNPKVREIWWCHVGMNIGKEIYGKGRSFLRPVLIINEYKRMFVGIPLTSNIKNSKFKLRIYTYDSKRHCLVLNQVRSFDKRRLIFKIYTLSKNKYKIVNRKFNKVFKNKTTPIN